jgi:hypothetical protein
MPHRSRTRVLAATAVAVIVAIAALRLGLALEPLLWFAPAVLLLLPLLGGWFVGEAALQARRREPSRRRCRVSTPPRRPVLRASVSGGRLIACALGKRGPPAFVLAPTGA